MKWITRERIKVDRVACPWLIRNFIDREAEFVFLSRDTDWSKVDEGILFDVPKCELGHKGEDVSFNSILKKYKLSESALLLLGDIVRRRIRIRASPAAGEGSRARALANAGIRLKRSMTMPWQGEPLAKISVGYFLKLQLCVISNMV